ncbi:family 20 glycosylhydrolase [Arenibacter sp. S6351L]|uniref:family 20 glycosylhydrolase n=1 Tax=Arenibacter sp. S6351L TaxID=2926407 RepID=UPI001FF2795E|nr:family 20 glycosylhydrolase [Arenibacter sp. S6351L]MCK0135450.1 beta-N-acetylhexosaminidase [Arenibacter sp. S6351L]
MLILNKKKYFQSLKKVATLLLLTLFVLNANSQEKSKELSKKYPIIPTPQELKFGKKEVSFTSFNIINNEFKIAGLHPHKVVNKGIVWTDAKGINIEINQDKKLKNQEGYTLKIDKKITIAAPTLKGAYYGLHTLGQLIRENGSQWTLPQLDINDWPAFKIRGFMHDTGRNFQSLDQLKEQLDILAQYKLNIFHWHLTDNPGWRLESKLYPEIQSDKTFSRDAGLYYTQEDFKEILAYCKERQITVIPEFDIPGHTDAFRKAFGIKSMMDQRVLPILLDLFDELTGLADADEMPYIHIGTDEVRNEAEYVEDELILAIMDYLKNKDREIIVWKEGIVIPEDSTSINQLWAQFEGREGHRFIDSRSNYINHLDPLAGMARLYFQQPCRQPSGDSLALGGILCVWPDNNVAEERDILKQNPIYPSIVFYSDAIWKGREKNYPEFWAKIPKKDTKEFKMFKNFEQKVLTHRDLFFKDKEFPYVEQTVAFWKVIGPFDHKGNFSASFPVEEELAPSYSVDSKVYTWDDSPVGATVHLKHFFGFPAITDTKSGTYYAYTKIYSPNTREQAFWIGFHGWSRAGGRRGGPVPNLGQWHTTQPKIWVNDQEILPPIWQQPGLGVNTDEIPFLDEDYFYRKPTIIKLNKGWNTVLLKVPHGGNSWKWMYTCIPVTIVGNNVGEAKDLIFDPSF